MASTRKVVLVTGMSGTGKSTVLAELARRGHDVVDTDTDTDDDGWIVEVPTQAGSEPMWDLDRIVARLREHRAGWLFVAGCVANQRVLYDRFDALVLLSAPVEVVLARVADRANPFGSRPHDRARSRAISPGSSRACAPAPTTRSSRPCPSPKSRGGWRRSPLADGGSLGVE